LAFVLLDEVDGGLRHGDVLSAGVRLSGAPGQLRERALPLRQPLPKLVPFAPGCLEVGEHPERLFPVEGTGSRAEHGDRATELFELMVHAQTVSNRCSYVYGYAESWRSRSEIAPRNETAGGRLEASCRTSYLSPWTLMSPTAAAFPLTGDGWEGAEAQFAASAGGVASAVTSVHRRAPVAAVAAVAFAHAAAASLAARPGDAPQGGHRSW